VVNYFDNQLDPGTGTLQARAVFDNRNRMLAPGMFVRVRLPIDRPYQALLIPEQALGTDQGQKFVYVIDDQNKAQYRRVEVGKLENGQRVVLGGITASDRVIVSGLQRVRPGAEVSPRAEEPASATAQAESAAGASSAKTASHQ
jgi:RND family efflux transporter MFP subunit